MRAKVAMTLAVLVTTALAGGVSGVAAGAQPTIEHPADGSGLQQTDDATCEFPVELTDATGTTVTLDERPERITTTNPSAAQTLWEIGARDRVVGVTQYASYLNGTEEKANVSAAGFGVNVERVVETDPDLVLAPNASAGQVDALREQGLTVYHFPQATSVDDIANKTETIGRLVGECESAADTNAEMNRAVADVGNRTADLDRPAALYPLGGGYVAAGNTFINEIMVVGGVDNVAAEEHEGYPQLSNEVILETDPELVIVTDPEASILDEEPYASTTAGVEGNYVVLNVNYLNQPAPRSVIESTETLATAVEELQAESDGGSTEDGSTDDGSADDGTTDDGMSDDETTDDETSDDETDGSDGTDTSAEAPGFGVVTALIASIAAGLLARRE